MNGSCPACGVAVVPGYVRCPKCHAPLPASRRIPVSGGTALPDEPGKFPLVPVLLGGILVVGIAIVIASGGKDKAVAAPAPEAPAETATQAPSPSPSAPVVVAAPVAVAPAGPDRAGVAAELERELKRQKLWSEVSVAGSRIDIRGGSCGDPALVATVDAAAGKLRAAGLATLRCVAQAGAVQLERDL